MCAWPGRSPPPALTCQARPSCRHPAASLHNGSMRSRYRVVQVDSPFTRQSMPLLRNLGAITRHSGTHSPLSHSLARKGFSCPLLDCSLRFLRFIHSPPPSPPSLRLRRADCHPSVRRRCRRSGRRCRRLCSLLRCCGFWPRWPHKIAEKVLRVTHLTFPFREQGGMDAFTPFFPTHSPAGTVTLPGRVSSQKAKHREVEILPT